MALHDRLLFDGVAVRRTAADLVRCAVDADDTCRRAVGSLEFGNRSVAVRYRGRSATVEDGYRRLREVLAGWSAETAGCADALRTVADRYAGQEHDTAAALRRVDETSGPGRVAGEWGR
ncbi:hypothetical protein [Rhodococcus chondri]|uniref:Uncharacterized protein n=1 Tax=Rhodococcus chondri TaxID=3065941 RepID=A0ABU7JW21_9NOCA|nr:hypothetical protein [Rhodococcus sp. CC-R104]MEE2034226.1 hypothetical protein [Rhodococcus sp. CC-R104]